MTKLEQAYARFLYVAVSETLTQSEAMETPKELDDIIFGR